MRYQMGMSYDEAAEILRMPPARVRLHVSRGIAKLRATMVRRGSPIAEELVAGSLAAVPLLGVPAGASAIIDAIVGGHPPAHLLAAAQHAAPIGIGALLTAGAAALALAAVVVAHHRLAAARVASDARAEPALTVPALNAPALNAPAAIAEPGATPAQRFLATTVAYSYHHDSALSVVSDLQLGCGLASGAAVRLPLPLAGLGPIDASGQAEARDVLALLARVGLAPAIERDAVVLWRPASAADLSAWRRDLADADPRRRGGAVVALEESGDRAAPAALADALADADAAVADLALDGLARYADVLPWVEHRAAIASAVVEASARAEPQWRHRALASCAAGLAAEPGIAAVRARLGGLAGDDASGADAPCAAGPGLINALSALGADEFAAALGVAAPSAAPSATTCSRLDELYALSGRALCLPLGSLRAYRAATADGDGADQAERLAATPEDRRAWAVALCARLGDAAAASGLAAAARDAEPTVRARAALGMGESRLAAFVDALAALAAHDPELTVRQEALWALGELRGVPQLDGTLAGLQADAGISIAAALARSRQHPGEVSIVAHDSAAFGDQHHVVVDTVRSDGNVAARDVLAASSRCRAYALSCLTGLPGLRVVHPLAAAATPLGACAVECEARLAHASLDERTDTLCALAAAPAAPAAARPPPSLARPVAGELPSSIDLARADGHCDVVRICARGGVVRGAIVDCYAPGGQLEAAYLATAWRGADGAIYVDARHASVIGLKALSWSPDSMRIPSGAPAESRDDAGQSLTWSQVAAEPTILHQR